jgi:hypothetical protein
MFRLLLLLPQPTRREWQAASSPFVCVKGVSGQHVAETGSAEFAELLTPA